MAPKNPRNNELRKAALIPLWICQLCPLMLFLVFLCLDLRTVFWGPWLAFGLLLAACIICNIVEIILFAEQKLRPIAYLILSIVKTKIFLILFLINLIPNTGNYAGIIPSSTLLAVHLGSLIYASVIVHRQRRTKNSPFAFKQMYSRRVSKDDVFGDQVELVRAESIERPASALVSKFDQRYQEHVWTLNRNRNES